jgi:hypothetical protein
MVDYRYNAKQLTDTYKRRINEIQRELNSVDITDISRASAHATLAEISRILSELNAESAKWVAENVPIAAREGVAQTLVDLKVADTLADALKIVSFNRMNQNMIAAAVADTQADLLAVTQNVDRKTRSAVRKAMSDSMRANMTVGINGRRTISRDMLDSMRKTLGESLDTGIIDRAGRRWKPEVYVDMAVRTKMMETHREASTNEAIKRGAYYAVISSHGATDACRYHEGSTIKLTPEAPGDYPTYDELKASDEIWHPNCRHTFTPIRNPQ